jgi:hypothetical protein
MGAFQDMIFSNPSVNQPSISIQFHPIPIDSIYPYIGGPLADPPNAQCPMWLSTPSPILARESASQSLFFYCFIVNTTQWGKLQIAMYCVVLCVTNVHFHSISPRLLTIQLCNHQQNSFHSSHFM